MNDRPKAKLRHRQAGVTLVEVLVVLVLVGVMAGAVGLSLGPADRGGGVAREAQLLVARLNRAADEVMITGQPMALVWTQDDYRFLALQDASWVPHPVDLLGAQHDLAAGAQFQQATSAAGSYVVLASLRPALGLPLTLSVGTSETAVQSIVFDGVTARLLNQGGQ